MKWLIVLITFIIFGCSENENPTVPPTPTNADPTLTGNWFGSDTSHLSTLTAILSESNTIITGSGTQMGFNGTPAFTVSGVNVYPNISLSLIRTGEEDMNFTGLFTNPNTVVGMWVRPVSSVPITFIRQ